MKRYLFLFLMIDIVMNVAYAGMPSLTLTDFARLRLSTLSFFLLIYFIASIAIFGLWHFLRQEFSTLPQLSFQKSLAFVFLWGIAFYLVLLMIAGTRELMTPKAWEKAGIIHQLAPDKFQQFLDTRRYKLEQLRTELWHFAEKHHGKFPQEQSNPLWFAPAGKQKYQYISGLTSQSPIQPLAYEPDNYGQERMTLLTNGMIDIFPIETIKIMIAK